MNSEWADQPPAGVVPGGPGAQLKAQREAMGWSVEQVADQLKLAQRQVLALEAGDMAALPNLAVVRGFIRAYAKVVKMDAAPLVAMIEVETGSGATAAPVAPARREISATFSETRFPSLTQRSSSKPAAAYALVALVVVAGAAFGAYKLGYISPALLHRASDAASASASAPGSASSAASADTAASASGAAGQPVETTLVKPGQAGSDTTTLQSPSVPLISVPPPPADSSTGAGKTAAASDAGATAPAPAAAAPAAATPATAANATAATAATPAPAAAAGANTLVLTVNEDSWIEVRRKTGTSLAARLVKAGSTETFDITEPALLVVGKPGGVVATLRGAPLTLPHNGNGGISRVNIK